MKYNEIRKLFLDYFESHGHKIVPSVSLIPNDPTLMFTVAGMVPFKEILQGTKPVEFPRIANYQKCLRAGGKHNDLDEVGFDATHHTFFEMLGNWSFGDYFKDEAIKMSWDLLTNVLKLPTDKLRVTTHITDEESTKIWKDLTGKDAIRLDKDNWWSAGDTGPCGPSTEIFYDMGADILDDDKRWVEIWNNVFMEYDRDANGNLTELPNKNVDTGAGLERWASVLQGVRDNYDTDLFVNLMKAVEEITGIKKTAENTSSFKILVDHLRAVSFAIADGIIPSNTDRGYVIRRILRRAMRYAELMGHRGPILSKLYPALVMEMGDAYPELIREQNRVVEIITNEENAFVEMLQNGLKLLDNEIPKIENNVLSGQIAFKLFDTYGFPLDLTEIILKEKNISVDSAGFEKCMMEQKERSRANTKGTRTLWEGKILSDKIPDTDDVLKYTTDNSTGTVLAILQGDEFVNFSDKDSEIEIALDKTPFYGTQGGQVGDSGTISIGTDTVVNITETNRVDGVVIHKGIVTSGTIKVGDSAEMKINKNVRISIERAHTAAHLLQSALRDVLNEDVAQKGSKVSPDSVRFDFSFGRSMTADEKQAVEDKINNWINAKIPVEQIEMTIEEAQQKGALALFGEKYGNTVKVVSAGDISCELCGGTHIKNTGDIIRAKINKEKSISSGVRRITMSVGNLAE